jgi:hypothetical protein
MNVINTTKTSVEIPFDEMYDYMVEYFGKQTMCRAMLGEVPLSSTGMHRSITMNQDFLPWLINKLNLPIYGDLEMDWKYSTITLEINGEHSRFFSSKPKKKEILLFIITSR